MDSNNPFETAVGLTKDMLAPALISLGEMDGELVQVLVHGEGLETLNINEYLDPLRPRPRRRKGIAKMDRLESLIAHTRRFSDKDSVIFADATPTAPSITAVLNYHEAALIAGKSDPATGEVMPALIADCPLPRFGDHRGVYQFPLSDEWKAWLGGNEVVMSQAEFAEFLEDRILDVLPPPQSDDESAKALREIAATLNGSFATAAKLMELSRGLAINIDARVKNAQTLASGEVSLQYEETHNDSKGQPISVPSLFVIGIPVFAFGEVYRIAVRLRYRVGGGAIKWFYSLYRIDRVLNHAVEEAAFRVADETGLPLLFGKPE